MSGNQSQHQRFDGMQFAPPADFELVETMLSLRAPLRQELRDPRMVQGILNKQTTVQPNLIVHRRQAPDDATLEGLVAEACAEFVRSMVQIENVQKEPFVFADQREGFLVTFDFPTTSTQTLRQFHAFRLDDEMLTTLTLTVDGAVLTDDDDESYRESLASLAPTE